MPKIDCFFSTTYPYSFLYGGGLGEKAYIIVWGNICGGKKFNGFVKKENLAASFLISKTAKSFGFKNVLKIRYIGLRV